MSYNRYMSHQLGQSPEHYNGPRLLGDSFMQTPGGSVQIIDQGSPNQPAPSYYVPGQTYGYQPYGQGAGSCPDGYIYDGYSCAPYPSNGPYGSPYNSPYFAQACPACPPCAPCAQPFHPSLPPRPVLRGPLVRR